MPTSDPISAASSVREVLTRHPAAEVVFARHGLLGCGGPNGPREPIGFFARVHRVDPTVLVRELNEFLHQQTPAEAVSEVQPRFAVIYPLFLMTSLTIALVFGFTTGMLALASAALDWPLPGISWPIFVQVHGRIQLDGWAGLFVLGVAYHVIPRFVARPLAHPRLVVASYVLAVVGLALSVTQVVTDPRLLLLTHTLFVAGLVALSLAAFCYVLVLLRTVRAGAAPVEIPIRFVLAGALWFVLGAGLDALVGWRSEAGQPIPSPAEEPALTALLVGFLVVTALGVSLRTLPVFLGLPKTRAWVLPIGFATLQLGVLTLVGGDLLMGDLGQERVGVVLAAVGAWIVLGSVLVLVWALRLFEQSALPIAEMGTGRGWTRAVRLAYLWLLIGLGLLAEELLRSALREMPIPWNTLGAARHALAVGFVTLLIVGMASRVIPVFAGKPLWKAWLVDVATIGIGVGALLRVGLEIATPYGTSFPSGLLLTLSGPLTWLGLIAFSLNFIVTLARKDPSLPTAATSDPSLDAPLQPTDLLAVALRRSGGLAALLDAGLSFLADPGHRAISARSLTLAQAARRADRDPDPVVSALNQRLGLIPAMPSIDPDWTVARLLAARPSALAILVRHGFTPLANPELRARLAPTISLRLAAASRGIDLANLLAEIEEAAEDKRQTVTQETTR